MLIRFYDYLGANSNAIVIAVTQMVKKTKYLSGRFLRVSMVTGFRNKLNFNDLRR